MLLLIVVAITAGLATAVSPCVLPILPIVLATGADGDRRRPFLVIAGLIASFSVFTLVSVKLIDALHLPSSSLRDAAIVVIALFGLTLLIPALGTRFERLTARLTGLGARMTEAGRDEPSPLGRPGYSFDGQPRRRSGPAGIIGGLVTGAGLGLVWTPCAGPILGAITSLAVTAPGSLATVALVIAYAIGAGLPLLAIAIGGRMALARLRMRSVSAWASRAFGVLVLATAGVMAFGYDTALSADLTNALPNWTGTLQTIERAQPVQAQLHEIGVAGAGSGISGPASGLSGLPVGPAAPDFTGVDAWLNSSPLTMADLKGKVVLVDFWTYSCINCIRTLPYVEGWYQKYAADGFVVVGVHTPEFAFEHDTVQRPGGDRPFRDHVPGGSGQRVRDMAGVQQPILAGRLPDRRHGPHPLRALRRGRLQPDRGRDPRSARRSRPGGIAAERGSVGLGAAVREPTRLPRPTSAPTGPAPSPRRSRPRPARISTASRPR
jgi:cytochrome c biogenesis protein CcdA/thiol-disulfide isomerase/thioredoxin